MLPCFADEKLAGATEVPRLFEQKRWEEVVRTADSFAVRTPELEYYHGVALAHLGRWDAAEAHLRTGHRLAPLDERFPIELAGIAFKQQRLPQATKWLLRVTRVAPNHAYANDFLGTVYFLQGNLGAALKYWNRVGKPELSSVEIERGLQTDPVLVDRAFTFAPGSILLACDLRTTAARIAALDVFSNESFRLAGRPDRRFDLHFTARERNGFGSNRWEALLSLLRGLPFQAVQPEYSNLSGRAINFQSTIRWDAQKRRLNAAVSGPLWANPQYRFRLAADDRDEQWELRSGPASFGSLGLRRSAMSADLASVQSGAFRWSSSTELSHRDYRDVTGSLHDQGSLAQAGYQLKHTLHLVRDAWRSPERRFESEVEVSAETGRIWSRSSELFHRLQLGAGTRWRPKQTNDDYAVRVRTRAGTILGEAPFDELFILGLERDNELWLRGHVGTHDGRKGSSPMGRNFVLWNAEVDKYLYSHSFFRVTLSPFLDTGKVTSGSLTPGPHKWLWDVGVQAKLITFGVGFTFTYGKDLRSGNNVFYLSAQR